MKQCFQTIVLLVPRFKMRMKIITDWFRLVFRPPIIMQILIIILQPHLNTLQGYISTDPSLSRVILRSWTWIGHGSLGKVTGALYTKHNINFHWSPSSILLSISTETINCANIISFLIISLWSRIILKTSLMIFSFYLWSVCPSQYYLLSFLLQQEFGNRTS